MAAGRYAWKHIVRIANDGWHHAALMLNNLDEEGDMGQQDEARSGAAGPEERHAMIAVAAYYLAEARGFAPGREEEDWLRAERAIAELLAGAGDAPSGKALDARAIRHALRLGA